MPRASKAKASEIAHIKPSPDVLALLSHTSLSQADAYRWAMADAVLLGIEQRIRRAAKESLT